MFNDRYSIFDYYRGLLKKVTDEIVNETDATIIWTNPEELAEYYFSKYRLSPVEFDDSREASWELQKYTKTIYAREREDVYQRQGDLNNYECEKVKVELPILSNTNIQTIADLQSSQYSIGYSLKEFNFLHDVITFHFETKWYWFNMSDDQIASTLESKVNNIKQSISRKNNDIDEENIKFKQNIQSFIQERVQKLKNDQTKLLSLTTKINIPLKKKENASARRIELNQNPIIKKIKPSASLPEEYTLDSSKVLDIIAFMDNQGKQFEKTPKAYESLWEEDLRDIFLVNLNSIFEWKATGETFSKKGKSDIYLNIDKGNILIFECKIRKWEVVYKKTIDQLRWYLTRRHNYWIMITFTKNKDFSEILSQMKSIIESSKSYIRWYKKINETHFVSVHNIEGDSKEVEVHHLFYNLYA